MRITLFCLLALLGFSSTLAAQDASMRPFQRFWEGGLLLGLTNYSGDLAQGAIDIAQTRPGFGIYARYHLARQWGVKSHVYFGTVIGDDKYSTTRKERSFRFRTNLLEIAAVGEWMPLGRDRMTGTGLHVVSFTPYVFGGVGVALANPVAEYYGSEDRRETYVREPFPESNLQKTFITAPVGLGLRLDFNERFIIGAEGGWRPVFSDYLDGISVNADPDDNDWYYFLGVTLSMVMGKRSNGNTLN